MWRVFLLLLCIAPLSLEAATVRVVPDVVPVRVGTPVTLTLYADVQDEVVNAIEASFNHDQKLRFVDASDNDSSVLFWIRYPSVCTVSMVCFSGIAPGGFTGMSQGIASLTFMPIETGTTTVSFSPIVILRHDGKGSTVPVVAEPVQLYIEAAFPGAIAPVTYSDTEPPEAFNTQIITDPDVYDGAHVLIFDTKDKQTKVVSYFVKEYTHPLIAWFAPWHKAQSPYRLRDQQLQSYVAVMAVDEAGNERLMSIEPRNPSSMKLVYSSVLSIVVVILSIILYRRRHS
jgi:hypothetical protein